jgi:glycosyltransferase involved in cell wall biosynthesis
MHAGRQMRVAIVTTSYWPIIGGQMIYARDLARQLVRQGHQVTVATRFTSKLRKNTWESLSGVDPEAAYEEDGVQTRVVRPRGLRRLALLPVHRLHYYAQTELSAIRLFRYAFTDVLDRAIGPCDVVHYNGVGREMLGFAAEALARRRGVPFVLTTHMHPGTWGDSRLDFRLYEMADCILAHTEWEKAVYTDRGIAEGKVRVVGIGVESQQPGDAERARKRYGLTGPVVLFVARRAHYKGYGLLLEAAPLVWQTVPDAHFVFVGPEQDEPTDAHRAILKDPRVIETGPITDQKHKADMYAACDVFCMPSTAESFGIVYIEAWQQRKPVVALALPALKELIEGCGGGVTVGLATPQAVAAALTQLLLDADMRRRMGEAGCARSQHYTPETIAARIADTYAGLCQAHVGK